MLGGINYVSVYDIYFSFEVQEVIFKTFVVAKCVCVQLRKRSFLERKLCEFLEYHS